MRAFSVLVGRRPLPRVLVRNVGASFTAASAIWSETGPFRNWFPSDGGGRSSYGRQRFPVDNVLAAGDIARAIGSEEENEVRDLLRTALPPQRYLHGFDRLCAHSIEINVEITCTLFETFVRATLSMNPGTTAFTRIP